MKTTIDVTIRLTVEHPKGEEMWQQTAAVDSNSVKAVVNKATNIIACNARGFCLYGGKVDGVTPERLTVEVVKVKENGRLVKDYGTADVSWERFVCGPTE